MHKQVPLLVTLLLPFTAATAQDEFNTIEIVRDPCGHITQLVDKPTDGSEAQSEGVFYDFEDEVPYYYGEALGVEGRPLVDDEGEIVPFPAKSYERGEEVHWIDGAVFGLSRDSQGSLALRVLIRQREFDVRDDGSTYTSRDLNVEGDVVWSKGRENDYEIVLKAKPLKLWGPTASMEFRLDKELGKATVRFKAWHGGSLISSSYVDRTYHFENVKRMECSHSPSAGIADVVGSAE